MASAERALTGGGRFRDWARARGGTVLRLTLAVAALGRSFAAIVFDIIGRLGLASTWSNLPLVTARFLPSA